ncbi:MAG: toll/interleukin-1 receptor domain-containing protein [Candidatus Cloacimonadales bacterium]
MDIKYQIIILGQCQDNRNEIESCFMEQISLLGVHEDNIIFIDRDSFVSQYSPISPSFSLYFGSEKELQIDDEIIKELLDKSVLILPIYYHKESFMEYTPEILHKLNGFLLESKNDINSIVNFTLEGLGLLRQSRRVFISYKRSESSSIAIQLYEKLEKNGFDVFLDTHSIKPGDPFQDVLWHRMTDSDVVIIVNTPNFLKSKWTKMELARANSMSICILHILWPKVHLNSRAELSLVYKLQDKDIEVDQNNDLSIINETVIIDIVKKIESLRARSLVSRRTNIVNEFIQMAKDLDIKVDLQPEQNMTLEKNNKKILILPTVGVPKSEVYYKSHNFFSNKSLSSFDVAYLLYDNRYVLKNWLEHLDWLDNYLPVKAIKIVEVKEWLKS